MHICIQNVHQQHVNCLTHTRVLPVKTWLLIACDTAFYAIIVVKSNFSEKTQLVNDDDQLERVQ